MNQGTIGHHAMGRKKTLFFNIKRNEDIFDEALKILKRNNNSKRTEEEIETLVKATEEMDFFKNMNSKQTNIENCIHQKCCRSLRYEFHTTGTTIVSIGDAAEKFYIILNGTVNILLPQNPNDIQKSIHELRTLYPQAYQESTLNQAELAELSEEYKNNNITMISGVPGGLDQLKLISILAKYIDYKKLTGGVEWYTIKDIKKYFKDGVFIFTCVNSIGRGSIFGELAFLLKRPRAASIMVKHDVDLAVMIKEDYEEILLQLTINKINTKIQFFAFSLPKDTPKDTVTRFSYLFEKSHYIHNQIIFKEGDPTIHFYIVKKGEISLFRELDLTSSGAATNSSSKLKEGFEFLKKKSKKTFIEFELISVGGFFGDEILLNLQGHQISAIVKSYKATIYQVPKDKFMRFIQHIPALRTMLIERAKAKSSWIVEKQQQVVDFIDSKEKDLLFTPPCPSYSARIDLDLIEKKYNEVFQSNNTSLKAAITPTTGTGTSIGTAGTTTSTSTGNIANMANSISMPKSDNRINEQAQNQSSCSGGGNNNNNSTDHPVLERNLSTNTYTKNEQDGQSNAHISNFMNLYRFFRKSEKEKDENQSHDTPRLTFRHSFTTSLANINTINEINEKTIKRLMSQTDKGKAFFQKDFRANVEDQLKKDFLIRRKTQNVTSNINTNPNLSSCFKQQSYHNKKSKSRKSTKRSNASKFYDSEIYVTAISPATSKALKDKKNKYLMDFLYGFSDENKTGSNFQSEIAKSLENYEIMTPRTQTKFNRKYHEQQQQRQQHPNSESEKPIRTSSSNISSKSNKQKLFNSLTGNTLCTESTQTMLTTIINNNNNKLVDLESKTQMESCLGSRQSPYNRKNLMINVPGLKESGGENQEKMKMLNLNMSPNVLSSLKQKLSRKTSADSNENVGSSKKDQATDLLSQQQQHHHFSSTTSFKNVSTPKTPDVSAANKRAFPIKIPKLDTSNLQNFPKDISSNKYFKNRIMSASVDKKYFKTMNDGEQTNGITIQDQYNIYNTTSSIPKHLTTGTISASTANLLTTTATNSTISTGLMNEQEYVTLHAIRKQKLHQRVSTGLKKLFNDIDLKTNVKTVARTKHSLFRFRTDNDQVK